MGTRDNRVKVTEAHYKQVIDALYDGIPLSQFMEIYSESSDWPSISAIRAYIRADNARTNEYTRAREECADALADQVILVADSNIDPQRARNRMNARQFLASKLKPKVYGDKLDLDVTGRVDVGIAVIEARKRAQLQSIEPLTIDNEPQEQLPVIDPFS